MRADISTGRSRLKTRLLALACEGWSRSSLAWGVAWGVTLGIFPILGVSTAACGLAALAGKLNQAVVQSANYLAAPLKLALILPCVRLGEMAWPTARPFSLSIDELQQLFVGAPLDTLRTFAVSFGHAVAGWLVLAPFVLLVTHTAVRILLRAAPTQATPARGQQGAEQNPVRERPVRS